MALGQAYGLELETMLDVVNVSSVFGLFSFPTQSSYNAAKFAVRGLLEVLRCELAPYGVGVTTVNPGFVITAMTEKNRFRMPFLMKVDDAARVIADGLERGKRVIEFPLPMSLLMRFARLIPDAIWDRATMPYARRKVDAGKAKR